MQQLVNEMIVKCHTNLNLFAEIVIRMLILLTTSSESVVASAAAETVSGNGACVCCLCASLGTEIATFDITV
jgi:hypothetical protein